MNRYHLIILASFFLLSCNEFSDRNIDQNKSTVIENNDDDANRILGNLETINKGEFSLVKMIANMGTFVVTPTIEQLRDEFVQFNNSYNQYCQTLDILPDLNKDTVEKLRAPLQLRWKQTMTQYHRLASMNFGPGKNATSSAMSSIYSYDKGNKCSAEHGAYKLVEKNEGVEFFKIDNYNIRGLGSIEYFLFSDPTQTACERRLKKDRNFKAWFEKGLAQRQKDFCTYNQTLLADISTSIDELYEAWSPNYQYFTAQMLSGAKSPIEWVNEMTSALYTLDTVTKDQKLTFPSGLDVMISGKKETCGPSSCPNIVEHKFSGFSLEALKASIEGFRFFFFGINPVNGQNGMGYDDFLILRDHEEMAKNFDQVSLEIINRLDSLAKTTTLKKMITDIDLVECRESTSEDRKVEACALISDIRKMTDTLKFELTTALQEVSVPKEASGDND